MRTTLLSLCIVASAAAQPPTFTERGFAPGRRAAQQAYENSLNDAVSREGLAAWHEKLAAEPHIAGTDADERMIVTVAESLNSMGLDTKVHWIWPYLTHPPKAAALEIVSPIRLALDFNEPAIAADPDTAHPGLSIPFSGYSGSGDVTARVVYANHGTKEDFEKLAAMGVDVKGAIVIARYGKNFRGYKAKFTQEAGAAGLIIYTDPAQSGYMRGLMYPEGGWATERQVERGSLATLGHQGDPLTPGYEATEDAPRLGVEEAGLPKIPVQPVGWSVAAKILEQMKGQPVPDESWQGALPFSYRVTGGPELQVRLMVEADRAVRRTGNVIARLTGSTKPDELIILGCHHDAWGFGASDPLAGLHVMLETARIFAQQARRGERPERTIIFAAWGAEEHGIIGSSEWVEANRAMLMRDAVLYINLDMASMGPLFGGSAAPTLSTLIIDAARSVRAARDESGRTAFDEWAARTRAMSDMVGDDLPRVGSMGGGSDHVGFYFHAAVPALSIGGSGSRGTAYHSNYDTIRWYRLVVGEDYEPSRMVTQALNVLTARAARSDLLPIDPTRIAPATRRHLDALEKRAKEKGVTLDTTPLRAVLDELDPVSERFVKLAHESIEQGKASAEALAKVNRILLSLERAWMDEAGLPGRPWMKSRYMAPDEDSGYASWPLPAVRWGVERNDPGRAAEALQDLAARVGAIRASLEDAAHLLDDGGY